MADRAENNKVPARNAPNSDQEPQRSRAPGDRPAPPHRDEMNRKTAPGRASAAPSSPAPVANRITATESPTKKACNRLLQQNLPQADKAQCSKKQRPARRGGRGERRVWNGESERRSSRPMGDRRAPRWCPHWTGA